MTASIKTNKFKSITRKIGYGEDKQSVTIVEWVMIGAIIVFCFLSFHYVDMDSILHNTALFARSIYRGQFFNFYEYSVENMKTNWAANYEIVLYVVFAIWNLPLLIADIFMDVNYIDSVVCILWSKLLLVVFIALTGWLIFKICRYVGLQRKRAIFGAFLYVSSINILFFTLIISQCDIIPTFFMLAGCYYFMKKKSIPFIICFALAIPMKMFSVFLFIPLVLLKEKKVLKIAGYLASGFSLQILCKLLFSKSEAYSYLVGSNGKVALDNLLNSGISLGSMKIPMFIFILIAICIYCYMKSIDDEILWKKAPFYLGALVFGSFFITYNTNTYWIVLLMPFLFVTLMLNSNNLKINLMLETVMCGAYMLKCFAASITFTILKGTTDKMALNRLFPVQEGMERKYLHVIDFFEKIGIVQLKFAFFALFVACLIALLVINYPRKNKTIGNVEPIDFSVIWARYAAMLVLLLILTFSYLKTTNVPALDTTSTPAKSMGVNIMNNKVSQDFRSPKSRTLDNLLLQFDNKATNRVNAGYIVISIADDNGNQIFSKKIGTSVIANKKDYNISLKGVDISADKTYTIAFTGVTDKKKKSISLMSTEELVNPEFPVYINGEPTNQNLYIAIR